MSYKVLSTEKVRKSGSDSETKALLYLMNFRSDSDEIYYFIVDFFNDLTGMDSMGYKLWDLQSKGNHNVGPRAMGKELITLFKNFVSDIEFHAYILFVGSVSGAVRLDSALDIFDITNIKPRALNLIKEGLVEEGTKKTYIDTASLTDENISAFLNHVVFVVDNDKSPSEYVKGILRQHPNIVPSDETLNAIFNEIREKQSGKKNKNVVENITIETSDEALNYCRHLTNNEIRMLAIQRIIQCNPLEIGITPSFADIYSSWPPEEKRNKLEMCQSAMCRALFNKNATDGFWNLFAKLYELIVEFPTEDVQRIFTRLRAYPGIISQNPDFDVESLKYFIAIVKDGIQK